MLLIHVTQWINLKCIWLSKRRVTQKAAFCIISFTWQNGKQNYSDRKHTSGFPGVLKSRGMVESKGYAVEILGWWNCFKTVTEVVNAWLYAFVNISIIVHHKCFNVQTHKKSSQDFSNLWMECRLRNKSDCYKCVG